MRRLTAVVSAAAVAAAVAVFLFFPRGTGAGMLTPPQLAGGQAMTGFSDEVSLNDVTRISQNSAVVADVELFKNGQKVAGTEPLLLRGLTLETYTREGGVGRWVRTHRPTAVINAGPDAEVLLRAAPGDQWRQKVLLQPTGTRTLFAMAGATTINVRRGLRIHHDPDGVLQSDEPLTSALEYEVVSTGTLQDTDRPLWTVRRRSTRRSSTTPCGRR